MRFEILASVAALAGAASAAPLSNETAVVFRNPYFSGHALRWPLDGKCHTIAEEAPGLDMIGSVKVSENILCRLHDSVNCDGSKVDIAHPGAGDLMMFMRWATRAKAMTCDRAPAKDN